MGRSRIVGLLGGQTSDHLPRVMKFDFHNKMVITAVTYNQMNACRSKADNGGQYSNNPFNITETAAEYKDRKLTQLGHVIPALEREERKDCFFLQEADWALYVNPNKLNDPNIPLAERELLQARLDVQQEYQKQLKAAGWDMVMSSIDDNCKPTVILYNTKTLEPQTVQKTVQTNNGGFKAITEVKKCGILPVNGKNTALEVSFTHKSTRQPVSLVGFHLDYEHDYSTDLENYFKNKANTPTVMGGDANHPLTNDMRYLISDYSHPSNIDSPNKDGRNLTTKHEGTNFNKAYDGFMTIGPNGVTIIEKPGHEFKVDAYNNVTTERYDPEDRQHQAKPGEPWAKQKLANQQQVVGNAPQQIWSPAPQQPQQFMQQPGYPQYPSPQPPVQPVYNPYLQPQVAQPQYQAPPPPMQQQAYNPFLQPPAQQFVPQVVQPQYQAPLPPAQPLFNPFLQPQQPVQQLGQQVNNPFLQPAPHPFLAPQQNQGWVQKVTPQPVKLKRGEYKNNSGMVDYFYFEANFANQAERDKFLKAVEPANTPLHSHSTYTSNQPCPRMDPNNPTKLYFPAFKGQKTPDETAIFFANTQQLEKFNNYFGLQQGKNLTDHNTGNCLYFNDKAFNLATIGASLTPVQQKGIGF
jgi:hypothetical protein